MVVSVQQTMGISLGCVVKQRLIKNFGYDEVSATDVLNFVASIFARGDVKE